MIFFDLDGTLMDQSRAERQAAVSLWFATKLFQKLDVDDFVSRWAAATELFFNRHLRGEISFQQQRRCRVQAMAEHCGAMISDADADQIFDGFLVAYEQSWCLFPDALGLLRRLRDSGRRLGIITNGDAAQQRKKLVQIGVGDFFAPVVISSEHKVSKPKAELFNIACELAGFGAAECWYIGDRLDVDAEASQDAGLNPVWLNRIGESRAPRKGIAEIYALCDPVLEELLGLA